MVAKSSMAAGTIVQPLLDLESSPVQGQLSSAVLDLKGQIVRGQMNPQHESLLHRMLVEARSLNE